MMNITRACQREMNHLRKSLGKAVEENLMNAIYSRLGILNTYHSLKMTEGFSLTAEETSTLLTEQKTTGGASFIDQLRASNHYRILNFCRTYQQQLENLSSADESVKTTIHKGISSSPTTFVTTPVRGLTSYKSKSCCRWFIENLLSQRYPSIFFTSR